MLPSLFVCLKIKIAYQKIEWGIIDMISSVGDACYRIVIILRLKGDLNVHPSSLISVTATLATYFAIWLDLSVRIILLY